MGAWGEGAFDNDTAADWSWEFENADLAAGLRLITDALSAIAQADDAATYLDAEDGTRAVAAAELVVSINSQPIAESPYNETARHWIARVHPGSDPSLTDLARRAVSRVTTDNSELAQLWDETGSSSWRSAMSELRDKLEASAWARGPGTDPGCELSSVLLLGGDRVGCRAIQQFIEPGTRTILGDQDSLSSGEEHFVLAFHMPKIARADRFDKRLPVQQPGQRWPAVLGELYDHVGSGEARITVAADLPPHIGARRGARGMQPVAVEPQRFADRLGQRSAPLAYPVQPGGWRYGQVDDAAHALGGVPRRRLHAHDRPVALGVRHSPGRA
jgi:Domain of unknown function (DUF4259)